MTKRPVAGPRPGPTPVRTTERRPATDDLPEIEVVRSRRRRRTASARGEADRVVVQLPAGLSEAEEERLIRSLVRRVTGRQRAEAFGGDEELARRADLLADRWLDGVRATSVRWSGRMQRRWGSCTPSQGTIRISRRLAAFPAYVLDAILVHELAHLQVPGHGPDFWELAGRYPELERARGFLEGVDHVASAPAETEGDDEEPSCQGD